MAVERGELSAERAQAEPVQGVSELKLTHREEISESRLEEREELVEFSVDDMRKLLKNTSDSNQRLMILVNALERVSPEEFNQIFQEVSDGPEFERHLVMQAWLRDDQAKALDAIHADFPESLEEALRLVLVGNRDMAVAWTKDVGVTSMAVIKHLDEIPREEEIDAWLQASVELEEEPVEELVPEWVNEFPTGLSVAGTVQDIVKISQRRPERARYWISHSNDRRAVRRAAADVGWESGDLSGDAFDSWLSSLPYDVAERALAGRLERMAFENRDNPEAIMEEISKYEGSYNLDQPILLILNQLAQTSDGAPVLVSTLIGMINNYDIKEEAGKWIASPNVEVLDQSLLVGLNVLPGSISYSSAAMKMSSIESPSAMMMMSTEWARDSGVTASESRAQARAFLQTRLAEH